MLRRLGPSGAAQTFAILFGAPDPSDGVTTAGASFVVSPALFPAAGPVQADAGDNYLETAALVVGRGQVVALSVRNRLPAPTETRSVTYKVQKVTAAQIASPTVPGLPTREDVVGATVAVPSNSTEFERVSVPLDATVGLEDGDVLVLVSTLPTPGAMADLPSLVEAVVEIEGLPPLAQPG